MAIDTTSASSIITSFLRQYGLELSDSANVDRWIDLIDDNPQNIVIVEEELRATDDFKDRFPGLAAREAGEYNAISVAEYLQLEDDYRSTMRRYGLPESFYDEPGELAEFIANDVSPQELEQRVQLGFDAVRNAPDDVKNLLSDFYGIGNVEGALAAYYLDPERALPAIQREFESAQIAAQATRTGFGSISKTEAERIESLGVTSEQASAGFNQMTQQKELTTQIPGQRGPGISREDQMRATFGNNAAAQEKLRRAAEQRRAAFQGGGGASISDSGVGGLRSSS